MGNVTTIVSLLVLGLIYYYIILPRKKQLHGDLITFINRQTERTKVIMERHAADFELTSYKDAMRWQLPNISVWYMLWYMAKILIVFPIIYVTVLFILKEIGGWNTDAWIQDKLFWVIGGSFVCITGEILFSIFNKRSTIKCLHDLISRYEKIYEDKPLVIT